MASAGSKIATKEVIPALVKFREFLVGRGQVPNPLRY